MASRALKKEGKCPKDTEHRQVKYLNNVIEADHGKLKQLIRPFNLTKDPVGEACMIKRAFGLGPCVMSEAVAMIERHLAA